MNQRQIENLYIVIGLCLMFSVIGYFLYLAYWVSNAEFQKGREYQECLNSGNCNFGHHRR